MQYFKHMELKYREAVKYREQIHNMQSHDWNIEGKRHNTSQEQKE